MGLGDDPLGGSPIGLDAVALPSDGQRFLKPPAAIMFDPSTGRFVMREDGRFREVHPVDQMVSIALGLDVGSHKSAPTVGHDVRSVPGPGTPPFEASAQDRIRFALRIPLGRGDISIESITVNVVDGPQLPRGRSEFTVVYINLRLPDTGPGSRRRSVSGQL